MLLSIVKRVIKRNVVDRNRGNHPGIDVYRSLGIGRGRIACCIGGADGCR